MADLIISQPMTFTVNVRNGLVERPQRESLMRGDKMANRIVAELVDGSEPFDITGVTVKGKFCRPPNGDEIDLTGEAKGNVAEVQLTDQCYKSGGHYEARVILVLGGVERTILFISGDVLKSGSGNAAGDEETGGSGSSTGSGLPAGGTAGQVLVKVSSAQGDAIWKNLTATDVGARPNNWMPTAADVGALPSDGTAANANALNGKSASEYALKNDLPTPYSLPAASAEKLGGVKVGDGIDITDDGKVTVNSIKTDGTIITARNEVANPGIDIADGEGAYLGAIRLSKQRMTGDWPNLEQINPEDNEIATVYTSVNPPPCSRYQINGKLINSGNDSIVGYGSASVLLLTNGIARIDFSAKIETAGTDANNYTWGLNRDYFTAATGKTITPINGGVLEYLTSSGINTERQGMGGTFNADGQFWAPARVYNTSGAVGSWASGNVAVGTYLVGTCYGTYR